MRKVLLLGAGYANLSFLTSLPKSIFQEAEFTIISQNSQHYHSILLHEVVSGAKDKSVLFPVEDVIPSKVKFVEDTVVEIKKDCVVGKNSQYAFDTLLVGLGFQSDSFNIPGIKEYAKSLVNYQEASDIRENIRKELLTLKNGEKDELHFVVCGGGLSGIELVSSLADQLPKICKQLSMPYKNIKLTCVEAMGSILPMFSRKLSSGAAAYLEKNGVQVLTNCKVLECRKDSVIVDRAGSKEEIKASVVIWTAGVKGNPVIENSPFFTSQRSRVEINDYLQPINQENQEDMKNIFVLGDCCALKNTATGRFYPPTAQLAMQEGMYLAKVIQDHFKNKANIKPFAYHPQGCLCSLGNKNAVGLVGSSSEIKGKVALCIKHMVESKWRVKLKGIRGVIGSAS